MPFPQVLYSLSWRGSRDKNTGIILHLGNRGAQGIFWRFSMPPLRFLVAPLLLPKSSVLVCGVKPCLWPMDTLASVWAWHQPGPRILCFWHLSLCIPFPLFILPCFVYFLDTGPDWNWEQLHSTKVQSQNGGVQNEIYIKKAPNILSCSKRKWKSVCIINAFTKNK